MICLHALHQMEDDMSAYLARQWMARFGPRRRFTRLLNVASTTYSLGRVEHALAAFLNKKI
jgi:hypothetical protein